MNNPIKNILVLSFCFLALISCKKDDSALHDHELFSRLQSGSGSWKVEQVETWNANEADPKTTFYYPENDFYHFYVTSNYLFGDIADFSYGSFYSNDVFQWKTHIEAETDRVSFVTLFVGEGTSWTVEVNKRNKQVWNCLNPNNTFTRITLKKCDCEFPTPGGENAG